MVGEKSANSTARHKALFNRAFPVYQPLLLCRG
nr:MAG TPA: hypothetical protein [Caudoviricetes sp.]